MPLVITPEVGIPLPVDLTPDEIIGMRERAQSACKTIQELMNNGASVEAGVPESQVAHQVMANTRPLNVAKTPPGAILKLEAMLTEYDHEFLNANRRLQNFVTNRLLEETEDEDPKVRLKALELLGKRRGVNLFSDQLEVTIKQRQTADLETELTGLLEKYMGPAEIVDAKPVDNSIKSLDEIDLDAELGLAKEPVADVDAESDEYDD